MAQLETYNLTVRVPLKLKEDFQKVLVLKGDLLQSREIRKLMQKFVDDYYREEETKKEK